MRVSEVCYRGMTHCIWLESEPEDGTAPDPYLPAQRMVVHPFTRCDGCGTHPIVGVRYHSLRKLDFDLCKACAASDSWARDDFARFDGSLEVKTEKVKVRCGFTASEGSDVRVNTLVLMVPKHETIADLTREIVAYLTQYSSEGGVEALYLAKKDNEWIAPGSKFQAEDYLIASNRLDESRTAGYYFKDSEESFIFAVCLPMRDNTQYSTWIPPSSIIDDEEPAISVKIAISQRRDAFVSRDDDRLEIMATPTVRGSFVKFERCDSDLHARRIHGELASTEVAAVSYAWGTLPHSKRLLICLIDHPGNTQEADLKNGKICEMRLGEEWNLNLLEDKLVELSERFWLWIDQLCLPQEEGLSVVLASEIAIIYSSCKVCCLVATVDCEVFRELQRASVSLKDTDDLATAVDSHSACCGCLQNWQVYFSRIWPWQEFTLGTDIQIHLGLGSISKFESGTVGSTPIGMAHNQIGVKLADRFWTVSHRERVSDFLRASAMLILGWGVRCDRRRKIAKFDTMYFLTWFSQTQKTATKMIDFLFAVTPMLELAPDFSISSKMSVLEGLVQVIQAFEASQYDCYMTGSIPIGMKMPTVLLPHRYRNALLEYLHHFNVTSSIDLLPFICSSGMMRKVNGFLVGYARPCYVEGLLVAGRHPCPIDKLRQNMSNLQRIQVLEFQEALSTASSLNDAARAVLAGLRGESVENEGWTGLIETHSDLVLNVVAVALGMLPLCAFGSFKQMAGDAALVVARIDGDENNQGKHALAIVNQATHPTHICASGGSLFIGTVKESTFFVCGRVLGSTVDSSLVSSLVQDFKSYTNGESVVKMVPCMFDLPIQQRQQLIQEILQPVIATYFSQT